MKSQALSDLYIDIVNEQFMTDTGGVLEVHTRSRTSPKKKSKKVQPENNDIVLGILGITGAVLIGTLFCVNANIQSEALYNHLVKDSHIIR